MVPSVEDLYLLNVVSSNKSELRSNFPMNYTAQLKSLALPYLYMYVAAVPLQLNSIHAFG